MVKPFSRNTRLENHSEEQLKVVEKVEYGDFDGKLLLTIPPGQHGYICYDDFRIEYKCGRQVEVFFYLGDWETRDISTSLIRDHEKIKFFKIDDDGPVYYEITKGSMIQMNGIVISMKGAVRKIKSLLM